MLCRESEVLKKLCCRAAGTKGSHRHTGAVKAYILAPAKVAERFYCHAFSYCLRQNRFLILCALLFKQIHTRHGYYTDLSALCFQDRLGLHCQLYLGAAGNEDGIWRSLTVVNYISAL